MEHSLKKMKSSTEKQVVAMVGTFDSKGEDFAYLHTCLVHEGVEVIAINTGVLGTTTLFPVAVAAEEVARAGGVSLTKLRDHKDRGMALDVMGRGGAKILGQLVADNAVNAVIGMGGGGGTFVTLAAMQTVPFGMPKMCLTTLATKDLSDKIGHKDIVLLPSIVDIAGLNQISRVLIAQAAGAICGMLRATVEKSQRNTGSIAMSVFGNTALCADRCTELLTSRAYDVLSFHAVGTGGKTMEALVTDGVFGAVLDLTTTELADELCGGICSAGPDRLTAAGAMGIPQVVVPGCLDMVNFGPMASVPKKYKKRQLFPWAPDVTLMRTNASENKKLGELMATKLNAAKGPVTVVLPLGGLSKIGAKGEFFYDPDTDKVLFDTLKANLNKNIKIIEIQANINTVNFADKVVDALLNLL